MYCACDSLFLPRVTLAAPRTRTRKRVTDGHGRSFGSWPWQKEEGNRRKCGRREEGVKREK